MNITESAGNASSPFEEGLISFKAYTYQVIAHPAALIICVPMNLIVAYVIISDRKLHNARNVIWLGVVGSNLTIFAMAALQHFLFSYRNYLVCRIVSLLFGEPYIVLLINIFLATCDRFIYTKWPLFHRRHVTVQRVIAVQIVCSTCVLLGLNVLFLAGTTPIQCGLDSSNSRLRAGAIAVLTLLCVVAKLVVYFLAARSNVARQHGVVVKRAKIIEQNSKVIVREISRSRLRIHCGSQQFRLMEWNATTTLVTNLIPLSLFVALSYLALFSQLLCRHFFDECEMLSHLEIYYRELAFFHACTDLLVYIFRSLEFRAALCKSIQSFSRARNPTVSN